MTPTRIDVLRLVSLGKTLGDYVPRYRPGATRGRGAFPYQIAERASRWLIGHGFLRWGSAGLELTDAGKDALIDEAARLRSLATRQEKRR